MGKINDVLTCNNDVLTDETTAVHFLLKMNYIHCTLVQWIKPDTRSNGV